MTTKQIGASAVLLSVMLSPVFAFAQTAVPAPVSPAPKVETDKKAEHEAARAAKKAENEAKAAANRQCVQTATDKREDAISSAWGTYSPAITAALAARKTALHASWDLADGKARIAARNAAWATYRSSVKSASAALKSARLSAWSAFAADSKTCKTPVVERSINDAI